MRLRESICRGCERCTEERWRRDHDRADDAGRKVERDGGGEGERWGGQGARGSARLNGQRSARLWYSRLLHLWKGEKEGVTRRGTPATVGVDRFHHECLTPALRLPPQPAE